MLEKFTAEDRTALLTALHMVPTGRSAQLTALLAKVGKAVVTSRTEPSANSIATFSRRRPTQRQFSSAA
jgi:hypothetical protein